MVGTHSSHKTTRGTCDYRSVRNLNQYFEFRECECGLVAVIMQRSDHEPTAVCSERGFEKPECFIGGSDHFQKRLRIGKSGYPSACFAG